MEYAYDLAGGSTVVLKKYQVAATNNVLGVPYLVNAGSGGTGIVLATTTGAADAIGVNIDTAGTYVTAQQSDNSDTARLTTIIVSPSAVFRARLSGSGTAGTALTLFTAASGGSDGLTVVMDTSVASPSMDEGTLFGYSGTNTNVKRKITSVSTVTATIIVALPRDAVINDEFLCIGMTPTQTVALTLTSDLTGIDASLAPTGAAYNVIETLLLDKAGNGRTNSYAFIAFGDHAFCARPT